MSFPFRILVVDDEPAIRTVYELLLKSNGYEVRTAADGFQALAELRRGVPDLLMSDLSMPNMNGFELLSVVRRRFPQIAVIAISGEYWSDTPAGLIADAFLPKGGQSPEQTLGMIAALLKRSPLRGSPAKPELAPLWIPLTEGTFLVTCTECLRSFPVEDRPSSTTLRETECIYCGSKQQFFAGAGTRLKSKSKSA